MKTGGKSFRSGLFELTPWNPIRGNPYLARRWNDQETSEKVDVTISYDFQTDVRVLPVLPFQFLPIYLDTINLSQECCSLSLARSESVTLSRGRPLSSTFKP
jgi:hypothetical protein